MDNRHSNKFLKLLVPIFFCQVLNDQQEFERAEALYKKGLAVDPKNANLLVHRALVMLQWKVGR